METKTETTKETLEGYVVDIACLRTIPSVRLGEAAKEHTTECSLMGHCMESGYGLVEKMVKPHSLTRRLQSMW
ncbi:hypothetical protein ACFSRY_01205 [Pontibacter locisalis]|uniref:Uncharacterized protein n=1 Tax=Pontibacter locisalis TaxID=1719035 RepID=A0ABW5IGT0_9BACT